MKTKLLLLALFMSVFGRGQVNMTTTGSYSQNFDSFSSTASTTWANNSTFANWYSSLGGTIATNTGTTATAAHYNYGSTSATERSFGSINSNATGGIAYGMQLLNNSGSTITNITVGYTGEQWRKENNANSDQILFYYRIFSSSQTSIDNVATGWTAVTALDFTAPIAAANTATALIGNSAANRVVISSTALTSVSVPTGNYIVLKWIDQNISGVDHGVAIDDVSVNWTITTATPSLAVSETALTAMDYVFGSGPSTPAKTFTVAGSNLAPVDAADRYVYIEPTGTNFEFSLDNSTFYTAGEVIPFPTGDGFSATTVYARLKAGLAVGTYTDATTITYYNAPTANLVKNLSLSGAVTAATATVTTGTISGSPFCVTASAGVSVSVPFTSTGTFTANTYTAQLSSASGSFASPTSIGTLVSNANTGTISATIPANTATGTAYRIRVIASNPSTTGSNNGTNLIINLASNSIAPTANQTIPIGVNGNTLTVTETSTPTSRVWKYGTTIGSYTTTTASTGTTYIPNFATAGTYYVVCESTFACGTITSNYVTITVNTPVITVTGTPTLFTYAQGQGPSAYQTLNVSGTSLTDNITITVPTANWELSTNIAFSSPSATITLTKNASTHVVSSTSVYVRLKAGLSQGFYEIPTDSDFVATSTNAVTKTADLDGQVTAPVPFINVEGNIGTFPDITPVTNTPSSLDNTLFAQQTIGASQTKSFRIQNLGGLPLTISSVTIVGTNPLDFTVTTPPPSTIAAGATVTFDVTFSPTSFGVRTAIVRIANNSNNITPNFDFNVQGTGNNPEIAVTGSGNAIPSGNTATSATNNTYLGNANGNPANPTTVSQNFVISNSGNVALNITAITITGADASQFSVSPTTATIAAGATGNITVTFAPTSIGVKNAIINIANNDLTDSENPYTFAVQGNAESYVVCAPSGDQILIIQNFDGTTPVWGYTVGALTFYDFGGTSSDGFWGVTTSTGGKSLASSINYTPITNNFLFLQDLQCENGDGCANTTGTGILTFDAVDISGKQNVKFSFDYDIYQFDTGDGAFYELFYDNVSQGEVQFITGAGDLTTEGAINISIPSTVNSFHFVLKIQQNGSDAAGFDNFKIIYSQLAEKTWNGTAWSGDGLPPTSSQKGIIDGPYITATNGSINCCSLTVNSGVGRTLTISSGFPLIVQNNIVNNGIINILNNGQLIQVNETDSNYGDYSGTKFQMERIAQAKHFDYIYWCSPTENFPLTSLPTNNRYEWDPIYANINGTLGNWQPAANNMLRARGYIVRASNNATTAQSFPVTFTGKPFNGTLTREIYRGTYDGVDYDAEPANLNNVLTTKFDDNWNLVGNPYPSAIDAEEFLQLNQTKIQGSIWVWKHGLDPSSSIDPYYGNFVYNYSSNDYIKFNGLGSTEPDTFNGQIGAGQGFFVNMLHTAATSNTITFTNNLRTDATLGVYDNSNFLRSSNNYVVSNLEEKHRIWLDIINTSLGQLDRTLVGYSENSTFGVDHLYDCIYVPRGEISIYSLIATESFSIQGRALPFNDQDLIPIGVKIVSAGNHKIAIKKVDGLFLQNQDIYLEDTLLNIIHDLKQSPYEFSSVVGVFKDRFKLRYTTTTLNNNEFNSTENIIVAAQSEQISIKSMTDKMVAVTIYDILGREIIARNNLSENEIIFSNITAKNQALFVKIKLDNGQIVTKKIIL